MESPTQYILVDVDTQAAFASPTGNLSVYSREVTEPVLENIRSLVRRFAACGFPVVGSVDSHSYDSWEFQTNGGPFPGQHAVKGTTDWLKIDGTLPSKFRFIPMAHSMQVGGLREGAPNRTYGGQQFAVEALAGVGIYFEKEVYSLFANPLAEDFLRALENEILAQHEGPEIRYVVVGFCGGGFCVDAAVTHLASTLKRDVILLSDAFQAIDGVNAQDGHAYSIREAMEAGASVMTTDEFYSLLR